MSLPENEYGHEPEGPVIRDRRRIDPETGELREPETAAAQEEPEAAGEPQGAAGEPEGETGAAELASLRRQLDERTADLKRVQAEYANYRKRVDRDRASTREQAVAQVVGDLLPILDDIGRAREHDELNGGFKSVGESLEALVGKLGVRKYAEEGDEFDPNVHEALTMVPSAEVTVPTVIEVFQPGYVVGERVLRPARVVVAGPGEETVEEPDEVRGGNAEGASADAAAAEPETPPSEAEGDDR